MASATPSPSSWPASPWWWLGSLSDLGHQTYSLFISSHFFHFTITNHVWPNMHMSGHHISSSLMSSDQNLSPDRCCHCPTVFALLSPGRFRCHPRIWNKNISTFDTAIVEDHIFSALELNPTLKALYNRIGLLMNRQLESGGWCREGTMVGSRSATKSPPHCSAVCTIKWLFSWICRYFFKTCDERLFFRENCYISCICWFLSYTVHYLQYSNFACRTAHCTMHIVKHCCRKLCSNFWL